MLSYGIKKLYMVVYTKCPACEKGIISETTEIEPTVYILACPHCKQSIKCEITHVEGA